MMSVLSSLTPRRRAGTAIVVAGAVGSATLALSMGATLSGYTASITNSDNSAASATLAVEETSGTVTCRSYDASSSCGTINKYGGTGSPMLPGGSQTTTVTFRNVGTSTVGSSNLTPGACSATSTGAAGATTPGTSNTASNNLCSVLNIAVYKAATATGQAIYNGSAAGFTAPISLGTLGRDAQPYTFVVSLPSSATTAVQGQQVAQSLVWNFSQ